MIHMRGQGAVSCALCGVNTHQSNFEDDRPTDTALVT